MTVNVDVSISTPQSVPTATSIGMVQSRRDGSIATSGKEASGTGNMKFSLNGALTIGTLDGTNVEIRVEVGEENFFLFGLSAAEVQTLKKTGYHPGRFYEEDWELREVIDAVRSGLFSQGDAGLFQPLVDHLLYDDEYLALADYWSYLVCQERVSTAFRQREIWTAKSVLNVLACGNSRRTVPYVSIVKRSGRCRSDHLPLFDAHLLLALILMGDWMQKG